MKEEKKVHQCIHYNMSVCGGFLGAYAVLNRCDVLGNAQTSNLIHLAMDILGRDLKQVILRVIAMLLYMCGTMLTVVLPKYTKCNLHVLSVLIDIAAVIILSFMPESMNTVVALYPVFFAMAFQWNVFADICGYASSTIFSTNNVRQMSISFTKYICDRQHSDWVRAKFYAGVLLFFHIGVGISFIAWKMAGLHGIYVGFLPLATALALVCYEDGWLLDKIRLVQGKCVLNKQEEQ